MFLQKEYKNTLKPIEILSKNVNKNGISQSGKIGCHSEKHTHFTVTSHFFDFHCDKIPFHCDKVGNPDFCY